MAASASFALVVGCGGSTETQVEVNDGSDSQVNALLSGVLIDSAVAGVEYTSESSIGITDSDGNFSYRTGESILFSIGDVEFPLVDAVPVVTPQTLASETANPANAVVNIARLLQSLDSDRNPDNGITVSESAAASSSPLNFAAPIAEFDFHHRQC